MTHRMASRKLWVTIWAMAMLTAALFLHVDLPWMAGLTPILGAVILAYVGVQGIIDAKREGK